MIELTNREIGEYYGLDIQEYPDFGAEGFSAWINTLSGLDSDEYSPEELVMVGMAMAKVYAPAQSEDKDSYARSWVVKAHLTAYAQLRAIEELGLSVPDESRRWQAAGRALGGMANQMTSKRDAVIAAQRRAQRPGMIQKAQNVITGIFRKEVSIL